MLNAEGLFDGLLGQLPTMGHDAQRDQLEDNAQSIVVEGYTQ